KQAVSILIVAIAVVAPAQGKGIVESLTGLLEADLVLGKVRRSLGFIPFELIVVHDATVYPYFVKSAQAPRARGGVLQDLKAPRQGRGKSSLPRSRGQKSEMVASTIGPSAVASPPRRLLHSAPMNDTAKDYSETLFLPKTDFPMRAGLPQKEPEILKRWEEI